MSLVSMTRLMAQRFRAIKKYYPEQKYDYHKIPEGFRKLEHRCRVQAGDMIYKEEHWVELTEENVVYRLFAESYPPAVIRKIGVKAVPVCKWVYRPWVRKGS